MKLLIALLLLASPVYAQGNATITGSLTFSDDPFGCSYGPHNWQSPVNLMVPCCTEESKKCEYEDDDFVCSCNYENGNEFKIRMIGFGKTMAKIHSPARINKPTVGTVYVEPTTIDHIFDLVKDRYADIQKGDCLVQQMCVSEGSEVKCYEFYIFNDGSVAMLPWTE